MNLYDPNSTYNWNQWGWENVQPWLDTDPGRQDAADSPMSYWTRVLSQKGLGGLDVTSNAARGLFSRAADAYGAARLTNPDLHWIDFVNQLDIPGFISRMSPSQRGENESNYAPGDIRWIMR